MRADDAGYWRGSEIRQPLGYAIVGGLAVSQILTLYTTPVVYIYFDRLQTWMMREDEAAAASNAGRSLRNDRKSGADAICDKGRFRDRKPRCKQISEQAEEHQLLFRIDVGLGTAARCPIELADVADVFVGRKPPAWPVPSEKITLEGLAWTPLSAS